MKWQLSTLQANWEAARFAFDFIEHGVHASSWPVSTRVAGWKNCGACSSFVKALKAVKHAVGHM
eukprot:516579-Prorocentrum_lima.AAC.1